MYNSPFFLLDDYSTFVIKQISHNMNTLEKIGKFIKALRTKKGLSQEKLCSQCGIDQHYISNIENGYRNLSVEIVERVASFFGLSLSQFFAGVEAYEVLSNDDGKCKGLSTVSSLDGFVKYMEKYFQYNVDYSISFLFFYCNSLMFVSLLLYLALFALMYIVHIYTLLYFVRILYTLRKYLYSYFEYIFLQSNFDWLELLLFALKCQVLKMGCL